MFLNTINTCISRSCRQFQDSCNTSDCFIYKLCKEIDEKMTENEVVEKIKECGFKLELIYVKTTKSVVGEKSITGGGWWLVFIPIYEL